MWILNIHTFAKCAAESQEKVEEIKKSETPNDIIEKQNVVEEAAFEDNSVAEAATEEIEINDEICPNEEYLIDDLNDENSVTFRFVVNDSVLSNSLDSFKSKEIFDFETSQVEQTIKFLKLLGMNSLKMSQSFT